jgi:hypothetical protein
VTPRSPLGHVYPAWALDCSFEGVVTLP